MIKKWLEQRKADKEKYRLNDEKEKQFFSGLKEYVVKANDTNTVLLKKLLEIVTEQTGTPAPLTDLDMKIGDDLGLDSPGIMNLLLAAEEEFDTEISYMSGVTEKTTIWEFFVLLHYCIFRWEKPERNM